MRVLGIGYGKNVFIQNNPERVRLLSCATVVDEYHMIVFARSSEGLTPQQNGNFYLYPTGGKTKVGMVVRAVLLARTIVRQSNQTRNFVVTTQDPFEAGLVGYLIARAFKLKLNLQEHGDFFSTPHWRRESRLNAARGYLGTFLLRLADTVRVVSPRMLTTMEKLGIDSKKLRLLSVEVALNRFLEAPASNVARTLFPADSIIVLTVARLVPQKNLLLLLHAFAKVVADTPSARLLIIGTGPELSRLQAISANLGLLDPANPLVRFLPWTDDVPSYMKSADIYALSSNYEGYARVLTEAMAAGLPVVTTDVGCAGSVLLDRVHGFVVPVNDEDAFGESLASLVCTANARARYGQAGIQYARELADSQQDYAQVWIRTLV